jgi:ADP-ribosylglycohydrolase
MHLRQRFRGAILGHAIGDALGMPVEGMSADKIKERFGRIENFLPSINGLKAGEWTDDTGEMIILAESILDTFYLDPENFANRLKAGVLSGRIMRIGPTTRKAVENLLARIPWNRSGVEANTCGAAMRVTPVGLVYNFSLNLVEKYAYISSIITHRGRGAIGGAVAIATAIACICQEFDNDNLLREVITRTEGYDKLVADKISRRSANGTTMLSWDAVPMAFYCFLTSDSYDECVLKAVNAGGDTDSIAAMAGAMKGAELGLQKIPEKWLKNVKDSEYLHEIADRLYGLHSILG